jgi:hypothetical protein
MTSPEWYPDWRHAAVHELQAKNKALHAKFSIDEWPRFDYDVDAGTLIFSDASGPKVRAVIQIAGSTSERAGDWLGHGRTHTGRVPPSKARCWQSGLAKNTVLASWRVGASLTIIVI